MRTPEALLDISDLRVEYAQGRRRRFAALDGVSFHVERGETVGVVGESGSGKSTLGRAVLGLAPVAGGRIAFNGEDITHASARTRRALSARLQVVFQDPNSSLSPTRTIGQTLSEPLLVHRRVSRREAMTRAREMLTHVGLVPEAADRHPAQFSGGQRQRIAIARALMLSPDMVICDEPVSALDVSVQAQVLNLLRSLQRELSLSYVFIAHDLAVVRHVSHRTVVVYRGQVMEEGPAELVYAAPGHPYTRALIEAAPVPDPDLQLARRRKRIQGPGDTLPAEGAGCPFAGRCPHVVDVCRATRPQLQAARSGRLMACHRRDELAG